MNSYKNYWRILDRKIIHFTLPLSSNFLESIFILVGDILEELSLLFYSLETFEDDL